jgi:methylase of polypeptide subunit release factors
MTDTINEARALLWTDYGGFALHESGARSVMRALVTELEAAHAQHALDVDYLRQAEDDRDRLIDALDAARAAMPTGEALDDLRYLVALNVEDSPSKRWLARLDAYHAAHAAEPQPDVECPACFGTGSTGTGTFGPTCDLCTGTGRAKGGER